MNDFYRNPKTNRKYGLAILCLLALGLPNSAQAQGQFQLPSQEQPIRDNAIARADFQQDLGASIPDIASQLFDAESNQLDALDQATSEQTNAGFAESIFKDFAQQTQGVELPKVFSSLAIVVGGYLGFVWLTRRLGGTANHGLPSEVVEVLGQTPFGHRKNLQLVRLGSKLLLLMNNHDGATQTIGEITDPHEVDYLTSICGTQSSSRSAIAIGKAASSNSRNDSSKSELKRVLRQLQRSGESNEVNTVFDA